MSLLDRMNATLLRKAFVDIIYNDYFSGNGFNEETKNKIKKCLEDFVLDNGISVNKEWIKSYKDLLEEWAEENPNEFPLMYADYGD